jgi:SAM-dependent methyltransferase
MMQFQAGHPTLAGMDVVDLRDFYASPTGRVAARMLNRQLATLTAPKTGQTVMGLGYALPYLPRQPEVLSLAFMLARQGVIHWPAGEDNRSTLVDDFDLPLLESTVDLALVVHGLEHAETPLETLQEVWRVMAPQGRLILVVPNRRGLWAASESTPFGYGQPFSPSQIAGLLKDSKYTVTQWRSALYLPPLRNETMLKAALSFDVAGTRFASRFAGVTIVEAMKQVYAFSSGKRARRLVPRFRPVLLPSPQGMRQNKDGE